MIRCRNICINWINEGLRISQTLKCSKNPFKEKMLAPLPRIDRTVIGNGKHLGNVKDQTVLRLKQCCFEIGCFVYI